MRPGLALLPAAVGQTRPDLVQTVVCDDTAATPVPASFTDPLHVKVPHRTDYHWTIDDWPAEHGATLPAAGTAVLLAIDFNQREIWVVRWKGLHS